MEQITMQITSMQDVMREIDAAQRKACTSIVEIGYILRKADDAELYKERGYTSIFEFAKQEYGWEQSQTSRFMSINKTYSVGGYSCVLEERYEGFGQAKLVEMLKLPEEIREEITPETKRDEIREMGKEYKAAEEVREQENFTRAFAPAQSEEGLLTMVVRIMLNMEMYASRLRDIWPYMMKREAGEPINEQDALLAIQPSGRGHVRAGSCFCFFRDEEFAITRGREKETHTYTDIVDAMIHLSDTVELSSPEEWYVKLFGKQLPEEKTVAQNVDKAHNSIGGQALEKEEKTEKNEPKMASKSEEKSTFSTGGVQESEKTEQPITETAVESGENNEISISDQPLEGQTEIGEFAEKMPISYENLPEEKVVEPVTPAETTTEAAVESGEIDENSISDTNSVVPDFVDGVCQVCAGAKDIESNDGRFRIHLTEQGIGRVEKDHGLTGYGIIEFDYCPKCGKELG